MDRFKETEALLAAIDAGSLAAAARRVGVTPAMLGRRIDALEDRLGVKLLHRSTRRLALTERGAVFAELQAGDLGQGERALAATIRAFRNHAARLPMADWPLRFWSLLSATPQLREAAAGAAWPPALAHLGELPADARAALLLRLAAGLDEGPAAQARGVDIAHYRDALARACPRDADGEADAAAWRQLAEVVQQRLRDLSRLRDRYDALV